MVHEFVHRLFGMEMAVLMMHMQYERETTEVGQVGLLFPHAPRREHSYPWGG